jgi:hypothetical protein
MSGQGAESGRRRELVEPAVREGDGHRTLADGGPHPRRRPVPEVSGGEDAREARLEHEGIAVERPVGRAPAAVEQVGTGEQEAGAVGGDAGVRGPPRARDPARCR